MLDWPGAGRHDRRMLETLNLIFRRHSGLLAFLFEPQCPRLRQEPAYLLTAAGAFSSGERVLVRIALDLWNSSGSVRLWDLIETLDEQTYHDVLAGLGHLRRIDPDGPEYRFRQLKFPVSASSPIKNPTPGARGVCRR